MSLSSEGLRMVWQDDDEDEWDDDASYGDDDEDSVTVACPHCGEQIHEDAQRCPYCEWYLSKEDAQAQQKPMWFYAVVAVCLLMIFIWIVGF